MIYRYINIFILSALFLSLNSCDNENPVNNGGGTAPYSQIDFDASWSQDGSKIVFTRRTNELETSGIYMLDYPGMDMYMVISGLMDFPDWSYDSEYIVFSEGGNLKTVNIAGDSAAFLFFGKSIQYSSWKWNPDWVTLSLGSLQNSSVELDLYNVSTSELRSLKEKGSYPSWNRAGDKIVYLKPVFGENGIRIGDSLMIFETASNNKKFVKDLYEPDHKVSSYPKLVGNEIYFSSTALGGKTFLYRININGSNLARIIPDQAISPDVNLGGKLVYTNREPWNGFLWILDINTGTKVQVTF